MSSQADSDALLQEALGHLENNDYAAAIPVRDRLLKANPKPDPALWCKGCALSALGRHAEAAAAYLECSKVAPDRAIVWFNLGNALQNMGSPAQALDCFDMAT